MKPHWSRKFSTTPFARKARCLSTSETFPSKRAPGVAATNVHARGGALGWSPAAAPGLVSTLVGAERVTRGATGRDSFLLGWNSEGGLLVERTVPTTSTSGSFDMALNARTTPMTMPHDTATPTLRMSQSRLARHRFVRNAIGRPCPSTRPGAHVRGRKRRAMFVLLRMKNIIPVDTHAFELNLVEALKNSINGKYAASVLPGHGLVICAYDVRVIGDAFLHHGSASQHVQATFRLLTFKPRKGQVIEGQISAVSVNGMHVTMGFFEHVFIPGQNMLTGSTFNAESSVWTWSHGDQTFHLQKNQTIRFKVVQVIFTESNAFTERPQPPSAQGAAGLQGVGGAASVLPQVHPSECAPASASPPMQVIGSINEFGLADPKWWFQEE